MKPRVVVVIVIWNGIQDTLECLASLAEDSYPNKQILVVDNGSTDGSAAQIARHHPQVRVLRTGKNLGFTGGNNAGLAEAARMGARYAFLLNNDTTLDSAAIESLVEVAERRGDAGMVAPVMHYYDRPESVWFSGARVDFARGTATHCFARTPSVSAPEYPSQWVSGCAILVRMGAVEAVGGFDDRFYLTWEDVDWSVRMRRAGWEVLVAPSSRIFHKGGSSGKRLTGIHCYYAVRNSLLFARKNAGWLYGCAFFAVLGAHLRSAWRSGPGNRLEIFKTIFEGLQDHLRSRYGPRSPKPAGDGGRLAVQPGVAVGG